CTNQLRGQANVSRASSTCGAEWCHASAALTGDDARRLALTACGGVSPTTSAATPGPPLPWGGGGPGSLSEPVQHLGPPQHRHCVAAIFMKGCSPGNEPLGEGLLRILRRHHHGVADLAEQQLDIHRRLIDAAEQGLRERTVLAFPIGRHVAVAR